MRRIFLFTLVIVWACNYDEIVPETPECSEVFTYEDHTREIISVSCATAGCHVVGGDGPGYYTTFNNISPWLNSDFFEKVIRDNSMPPLGSPELTPDERETLLCWIEADYPEN